MQIINNSKNRYATRVPFQKLVALFLVTLLGMANGISGEAKGKMEKDMGVAESYIFSGSGTLKVFVLTGQSNSLGTTADSKENDRSPGLDASDQKLPFFWANCSTVAGDGAARLFGSSAGKILTLQPQQGEGKNPMFWGPEIGFGRTLAASGYKDFMIVKASRGGGGNSFWLKGAADDHMYRHVVDTVTQALATLPKEMKFDIAGLLYVQGESDNLAEAADAGNRLLLLAENLRKDLPHAEHMKVLVGGIAANGGTRDIVRKNQSALASQEKTFVYFDNTDLRPQLYDNLHFNKLAKLELGKRFATAWMQLSNP